MQLSSYSSGHEAKPIYDLQVM